MPPQREPSEVKLRMLPPCVPPWWPLRCRLCRWQERDPAPLILLHSAHRLPWLQVTSGAGCGACVVFFMLGCHYQGRGSNNARSRGCPKCYKRLIMPRWTEGQGT